MAWWLLSALLIYLDHEAGKDMKHYLIMARSMFDNGIYFSTFDNNQLDLEKTPLLYWPLVGIWHLFGISSLGHYIYRLPSAGLIYFCHGG